MDVRTVLKDQIFTLETRGRPLLDLSVIICAYTEKRWDDLLEAVHSIEEQTVLPREVFVVVDHNPALLERVRSEIPSVVGVGNSQERGLSGARNTGIELAGGSVLAFMDEDAYAEPDWLERLYQPYTDTAVLGVGGAIEPVWLSGKPAWFPVEFNWVVGCTYRGMPEKLSPVRNLIGANMSFRSDVFDRSGGFIHGMGRIGTRPLGCEETEFCIRAVNHYQPEGYFVFDPQARVYHKVPRERANWRYFLSRCYSEGLSKAQVAGHVGEQKGLASERVYTFRTLPQGVIAGLSDALIRRDTTGFGRAAAILAGLITTGIGYLVGRITARR